MFYAQSTSTVISGRSDRQAETQQKNRETGQINQVPVQSAKENKTETEGRKKKRPEQIQTSPHAAPCPAPRQPLVLFQPDIARGHTHAHNGHTHSHRGWLHNGQPSKKRRKKDRSLVNSGQRSRPDSDGDDNGLRAAGADGAVLAMRGTVPHWV